MEARALQAMSRREVARIEPRSGRRGIISDLTTVADSASDWPRAATALLVALDVQASSILGRCNSYRVGGLKIHIQLAYQEKVSKYNFCHAPTA